MTPPADGGDRGQAGILVLGLFAVSCSILGLAVDTAVALAERSTLRARVDAAVLAAASGVDDDSLRRNVLVLSPAEADRRARAVLRRSGPDASMEVDVSVKGDLVEVTARRRLPTVFLRLVGVDEMHVAAAAAAVARPARP